MEQVKIFRARTVEELETAINGWLADNSKEKRVLELPAPVYEPPLATHELGDESGDGPWVALIRFQPVKAHEWKPDATPTNIYPDWVRQ